MTGHYSPLTSDFLFILSAAKIKCNFHSHQIFSAGYSSRLYMYIGIYNRYSVIAFQFTGKDNTSSPDFPNYSGNGSRYCVLGFFFSLPSTSCSPKYAYNPPNLCHLTHFWRIITMFYNSFALSFALSSSFQS